jgi:hypothetical protein
LWAGICCWENSTTRKLSTRQKITRNKGWNDAVTFDTVIDFHQLTKYFDPMDADTDSDYTSDSRDDLFDGVDRARAFDNDYDLDMHEPGD